jgi:HEAT repeat protein
MEVIMKSLLIFAALLLSISAAQMQAHESILPAGANKALIEENLLIGLASDNTGLQRSSALMLGRIKSDRSVISLMEVLHNNTNTDVRIAAAWALCQIGDARGVYAVKMAVKFDESEKVQSTCAWYYENFVEQGSFIFLPPEPVPIAEK